MTISCQVTLRQGDAIEADNTVLGAELQIQPEKIYATQSHNKTLACLRTFFSLVILERGVSVLHVSTNVSRLLASCRYPRTVLDQNRKNLEI